jgi:2-polyprenyl-6-methoxyphenol hydroxylase-like FAD-dependent oxidoreductase
MKVQCCIVGGGPAGMMLGFLLARAGVEVAVLEKHGDFLRDFRGDTVHPSTLNVMDELGLLGEFLKLPHHKVSNFVAQFGDTPVGIADFSHLPVHARFIAMIPQWDFLDFLAAHGKRYPGFRLLMNAEANELIEASGRVVGVRATVEGESQEIRSDLVVGADGRHSVVRDRMGLKVDDIGAPMDVLWFRLSHRKGDPAEFMGRFDVGSILVLLDRGDYWQCAYVIPKGSAEKVRADGVEKVRATIARLVPAFADRVDDLRSMDDLKLLTVGVDRLQKWWKPGVLCIGDAAHTMSPIGGVGINLAVQDAVAASNMLAAPLRERRLRDSDLAAVQERRLFPARAMQAMQVFLQNRVIAPSLYGSREKLQIPFFMRLLGWFPPLRRLPARLMGMGVRPEHVRTRPAPLAGS